MIQLLVILLLILVLLWMNRSTNRSTDSEVDVLVQPSPIQGDGLFANRRFVRGELILSNLFPGKDEDELLYDPIPDELFYDYMGYEAVN